MANPNAPQIPPPPQLKPLKDEYYLKGIKEKFHENLRNLELFMPIVVALYIIQKHINSKDPDLYIQKEAKLSKLFKKIIFYKTTNNSQFGTGIPIGPSDQTKLSYIEYLTNNKVKFDSNKNPEIASYKITNTLLTGDELSNVWAEIIKDSEKDQNLDKTFIDQINVKKEEDRPIYITIDKVIDGLKFILDKRNENDRNTLLPGYGNFEDRLLSEGYETQKQIIDQLESKFTTKKQSLLASKAKIVELNDKIAQADEVINKYNEKIKENNKELSGLDVTTSSPDVAAQIKQLKEDNEVAQRYLTIETESKNRYIFERDSLPSEDDLDAQIKVLENYIDNFKSNSKDANQALGKDIGKLETILGEKIPTELLQNAVKQLQPTFVLWIRDHMTEDVYNKLKYMLIALQHNGVNKIPFGVDKRYLDIYTKYLGPGSKPIPPYDENEIKENYLALRGENLAAIMVDPARANRMIAELAENKEDAEKYQLMIEEFKDEQDKIDEMYKKSAASMVVSYNNLQGEESKKREIFTTLVNNMLQAYGLGYQIRPRAAIVKGGAEGIALDGKLTDTEIIGNIFMNTTGQKIGAQAQAVTQGTTSPPGNLGEQLIVLLANVADKLGIKDINILDSTGSIKPEFVALYKKLDGLDLEQIKDHELLITLLLSIIDRYSKITAELYQKSLTSPSGSISKDQMSLILLNSLNALKPGASAAVLPGEYNLKAMELALYSIYDKYATPEEVKAEKYNSTTLLAALFALLNYYTGNSNSEEEVLKLFNQIISDADVSSENPDLNSVRNKFQQILSDKITELGIEKAELNKLRTEIAEKYTELEKKINAIDVNTLLAQYKTIESKLGDLNKISDDESIVSKLEKLEAQLATALEAQTALSAQVTAITGDNGPIAAANQQLQEATAANNTMSEQLRATLEAINKARAEELTAKEKLAEAESTLKELETASATVSAGNEKQLISAVQELSETKSELEIAKGNFDRKVGELSTALTDINAKQTELESALSKVAELKVKLDSFDPKQLSANIIANEEFKNEIINKIKTDDGFKSAIGELITQSLENYIIKDAFESRIKDLTDKLSTAFEKLQTNVFERVTTIENNFNDLNKRIRVLESAESVDNTGLIAALQNSVNQLTEMVTGTKTVSVIASGGGAGPPQKPAPAVAPAAPDVPAVPAAPAAPVTTPDVPAAAPDVAPKEVKQIRDNLEKYKKQVRAIAESFKLISDKYTKYNQIIGKIRTENKETENDRKIASEKAESAVNENNEISKSLLSEIFKKGSSQAQGNYKYLQEEGKQQIEEIRKKILENKNQINTVFESLIAILDANPGNRPLLAIKKDLKLFIEGDYESRDNAGLINRIEEVYNKVQDEYDSIFRETKANAIASEKQQEIVKSNARSLLNQNQRKRQRGGEDPQPDVGYANGTPKSESSSAPELDPSVIRKIYEDINEQLLVKVINRMDTIFKRQSNAITGPGANGEPSIFVKLYNQYIDRREKEGNDYNATEELVGALESNNLLPMKVLGINTIDKVIFIFVTLFIRLAALYITQVIIERVEAVDRMLYAISIFIGIYILLFLFFVLMVNLDEYRLRIIFNYVNFHANRARVIMHIGSLIAFMFIIFMIISNINSFPIPEISKITISQDDRIQLTYRLEVLTMIVWIFLVMTVIIS